MGLSLTPLEKTEETKLEWTPLDLTEFLVEDEPDGDLIYVCKQVALVALFLQSRPNEPLTVAEDEVTGILGGGEDDTWPPGTKAAVTLKRGTSGLKRSIQVQKVMFSYE